MHAEHAFTNQGGTEWGHGFAEEKITKRGCLKLCISGQDGADSESWGCKEGRERGGGGGGREAGKAKQDTVLLHCERWPARATTI